MAKVITEQATFDPEVVVPEGMDSRDHAAEDVESIAQRLANRTQYLKPLADGAMLRDVDNTLNGNNTFNGVNGGGQTFNGDNHLNGAQTIDGTLFLDRRQVNEPLIQTHSTAPDAPNPSGNRWDFTAMLKHAGGLYVHMYCGHDGGGRGAFAITVNARWDANTNQWSQQNNTLDSTALIWRYQDMRICRKPAGTAPWSSWQTTEDNEGVLLVETLKSKSARVTGTLSADAIKTTDVFPHGPLEAGYVKSTDWIDVQNEVRYLTQKERSHIIPITDGVNVSHYKYANQTREAVAGAPNAIAFWPIRLPVGSLLNSVWIHSWQAGATPQRFRLYAQRPTDWGSEWSDIPDLELVGEQSTTVGVGYEKTLVNCFAQVNVQADWEYFVEWRAATADAGGADAVIKLSCNYVDRQLSNQRTG